MKRLIFFIASFVVALVFSGCPQMVPEKIDNHLKITVKNNKPCFYIEEFDDIDQYDMQIFGISYIANNKEIIDIWGGSIYNKQEKVYPLSLYKDENHCIEYGIKNDFFQFMTPYKLQEGTKYNVEIIAEKRKQSNNEVRIKYDGVVSLVGEFYIKNKNGQLQIIMQDSYIK